MKKFVCLVIFLFSCALFFTQDNSLADKPFSSDKAAAAEEFRRGVQSFYRGNFNEAVLLFEKALSFLPGEPLIMDWLGKAYYQSGIEGAALEQWKFAQAAGYGGILLRSKIETIQDRRSSRPDFYAKLKFSDLTALEGKTKDSFFFMQPTAVAPMQDGSFWVVGYGSNEIVHFDINGLMLERVSGPLEGFGRPFDIIQMANGNLLVSEFSADRVSMLSRDGKFLKSFGEKGRGTGGLIGPQYLCLDEYENIYVCDFGNARIVVFSPDGDPLFNFGQRNGLFKGFVDPAGIAVLDGLVYVADGVHGAIYVFDTAGNYKYELLPEGTLKGISSVKVWNDNLVVADKNSVYFVDISLATITELASLGNAPVRIISAVPDVNGNLLLADYSNEKIEIASSITEIAGGMFLTVERVYSENFPNISLDVRVQNRDGKPIVGLGAKNFFVTEKGRSVADFSFDGAAFFNEVCDITILIERSPESFKDAQLIKTACNEIAKAMNGKGKIKIVTASEVPVLEALIAPETLASKSVSFKNKISDNWKFDLGLRLAAGELVTADPKRAVIFLNSGSLLNNGFTRYGLNDLSAFMLNNGIKFYTINLHHFPVASEIAYLTSKTGGKISYIYAEAGLAPIIQDILESPNGLYRLSYKSSLSSDFGRAFLPVEVEARLLTRSGRDETSYFAPLE